MKEALDLFVTRMVMYFLGCLFILMGVLDATELHSFFKTILALIMAAFFFTLASYTRNAKEVTK